MMKRELALLLILALVIGLIPTNNVYANNGSDFSKVFEEKKENLKESIPVFYEKGADYFKNLTNKFKDMKNHWADQTVGKLVELGVINGYEDGTFKPNNTITRAEFSTIVRKGFKFDEIQGNSFTDTQSHWAKNEIHTLVEEGVIKKSEYGEVYNPNKNITRLEMAKKIVRALGLDEQAMNNAGKTTKFYDNNDIPSSDRGYIIIASDNKIINGYPDQTFKPNGEATRAEASTMVINALEFATQEKEVKQDVEELRNDDGYIETNDLEEKTFEEKGYDLEEEIIAINRITGEILYTPKNIIEIEKTYLPIRYEELIIENYEIVKYEDTFLYGKNSYYWGLGQPIDLLIVEGKTLSDVFSASYEVLFLNESGERVRKTTPAYIYSTNDEVTKLAKETYPNMPNEKREIANGKNFTFIYPLSPSRMEKSHKILFYDQQFGESIKSSNVIEIPLR